MTYNQYIDRKTGELLNETVPAEKWLKWLYGRSSGKIALHAVKRKCLSSLIGRIMGLSLSRYYIKKFVTAQQIDVGEIEKPLHAFNTFNDFFIRTLKPDARIIHPDERVLASPADGKILIYENMTSLHPFFIKGQAFSLASLLRNDLWTRQFTGGCLFIIRLSPADYHRFHFPAAGRITPAACIDGSYYSVSPRAVKERMAIYWENRRSISLLTTEHAGDLLICEIGATFVGSIVQNYKPEITVRKGQEKGWFQFGGSTIVLIGEPGRLRPDADIVQNTRKGYETRIKMGESIATAVR